MKFTVDRKKFLNTLKKFLTEGRLSIVGSQAKKRKQTVFANIIAKDNSIVINGTNEHKVIYVFTKLDAEIEKEGELSISDLVGFFDKVKRYNRKTLTIEKDSKELFLTDGKKSFSYGTKANKARKTIKLMADTHCYKDGVASFHNAKTEQKYDFEKLFVIEDGKELKDIHNYQFEDIVSDFIFLNIDDNTLTVSFDNSEQSSSYSEVFDVKTFKNIKLKTKFIGAILNNIEGETEFHYHITVNGRLRLWIHNGNINWLVRFDKSNSQS